MKMYFVLLVALIVWQRLLELLLSRKNEKRLRRQGAYEVGRTHYQYIVAVHVAFLASLCVEVVCFERACPGWWIAPFLVFVSAQVLRLWSQLSLGRRWTTRILILPNVPPVTRGIYRYFQHPNYLAVVLEFLAIPLIFQAYVTACIFTLLNALVLSVRIPVEMKALTAARPKAILTGGTPKEMRR